MLKMDRHSQSLIPWTSPSSEPQRPRRWRQNISRAKIRSVGTICGCGQQGRAQLRAIRSVLPLQEVYAFDSNFEAAKIFAAELSRELKIDIEAVHHPKAAIRRSDVLVTSTTATGFFVHKEDVPDGAFIAAGRCR